jgi:hypothetical protein
MKHLGSSPARKLKLNLTNSPDLVAVNKEFIEERNMINDFRIAVCKIQTVRNSTGMLLKL